MKAQDEQGVLTIRDLLIAKTYVWHLKAQELFDERDGLEDLLSNFIKILCDT
jgi:hypothetical protein